jgi:hypothetical protein
MWRKIIMNKRLEKDPRLPGTIYHTAKLIEDAGGQALPVICNVADLSTDLPPGWGGDHTSPDLRSSVKVPRDSNHECAKRTHSNSENASPGRIAIDDDHVTDVADHRNYLFYQINLMHLPMDQSSSVRNSVSLFKPYSHSLLETS